MPAKLRILACRVTHRIKPRKEYSKEGMLKGRNWEIHHQSFPRGSSHTSWAGVPAKLRLLARRGTHRIKLRKEYSKEGIIIERNTLRKEYTEEGIL